MREYDDQIQHYAPVLRRIIILVAIITAVPVMLWTITAFMRTYVAQPTIPTPRPIAAATDTDTANPAPAPMTAAAAPIVEARATATDARGTDGRSDRIPDSASNTPTAVAPPTVAQPAPTATAMQTAPAPVAPPTAAPAAAPDNVFPNPAPALAAQLQQAQPAAPDVADDTLPPADPIVGPIPLPRHRPTVFALAETTGSVPLPRARPSDAPAAPEQVIDQPRSGYDPGIGH
jgi:hypothetical protein